MNQSVVEEDVSSWAVLEPANNNQKLPEGDEVEIEIEEILQPGDPTYKELANKISTLMMQLRASDIRYKTLEKAVGQFDNLIFKQGSGFRRLLSTAGGNYISVPCTQAQEDAKTLLVAELRGLISQVEGK